MSFILRPVARASSSTRSVARASLSVVPRRRLHVGLALRAESLEVPTPLSAVLPPDEELTEVDPTELAQDSHVLLPSSIPQDHPYAESRLATANLIRAPDQLDRTSFSQLSTEILLLRGNDNFFQNLHSPLLWHTLEAVTTKDQFREFLELLKVWRMEGGFIDWRIGTKIVELSLEHKTPLWALKVLMHPTTFGSHLFSPSHPPYPQPTSIEPLSEADSFWMHTTALADSDARDLKYHLWPSLPRVNPYITLPDPKPMYTPPIPTRPRVRGLSKELVEEQKQEQKQEQIPETYTEPQPIREGVTEPEAARQWIRAVLSGDAETDGKDRALTQEESTFVADLAKKFFPNDRTLTAEWLTHLSAGEADPKTYKRFLYAQNELSTVDSLVAREGEDGAVVQALIASAAEWSGKEGEGWPLFERTKELLEGKTVGVVDPEVLGNDRTLGYGMGGLVGAKEGEQEVEAETEEGAEEKKD